MSALDGLKISGRPLRGATNGVPQFLLPLYRSGDGISAFSGALLVPPYSVSKTLHEEGSLSTFVREGGFCFAFDVFGAPFVLARNGQVDRVDPETREITPCSANLEDWANRVSASPNHELGAGLASEWQLCHRELLAFERLVPKRPFVMGGDFVVGNLVPCELQRALSLYSTLSAQLVGISNGVTVTVDGWTP
ncbi:MAG: hypothetical protein Q8N26_07070 [Myxococcales bacterium]|nr:hypothetical protein [Myxococcales bacterium]